MMTNTPRDPNRSVFAADDSSGGAPGIRSGGAEREVDIEVDNEAWLESLIIELRLLDVSGQDIGDAVASAREFLSDSGTLAEESFGDPTRYAAELGLRAVPRARSSMREVLLTSGIGVIGLVVLGQAAFPLAGGDDDFDVRVWMVAFLGALVLLLSLIPRVIPVLLRARSRPLTVGLILAGIVFGGFGPVLLSVWWGQAVLFSVPALPVAVGAGILLLAPAAWNHVRHTLRDDPIIEPGESARARPSVRSRILILGTNWMLVIYGAVSLVLTFALYPHQP